MTGFETAAETGRNPGAAAPAPIVQMTDVLFTWPGRNAFSLSIDSFSLERGERLLLIGPSGSGKSTFLSLLAGIITPQRGIIDVLGTDIARLRGAARDRFRAEHYGIIFQMFNLLPYGSVDRQCPAAAQLFENQARACRSGERCGSSSGTAS